MIKMGYVVRYSKFQSLSVPSKVCGHPLGEGIFLLCARYSTKFQKLHMHAVQLVQWSVAQIDQAFIFQVLIFLVYLRIGIS